MNFTFFESYYDAIRELGPEDRLSVYDAICGYGVTGVVPELSGVAAMAFKLVKPNIDKSHSRSQAGKIGGEANRKQTGSKPEANSHDAESKTEQDKDKEKDKDKDAGVWIRNEGEERPHTRIHNSGYLPMSREVEQYVTSRGQPRSLADEFLDYMDKHDWVINGEPVRDWMAVLSSWIDIRSK